MEPLLPPRTLPMAKEATSDMEVASVGLPTDPTCPIAPNGTERKTSVPWQNAQSNTTWAELFYDLFLMANFNVFTNAHSTDNVESFQSFIGLFCLLWMTRLQQALFDVRYGKDCWVDRIFRFLQCLIMGGFVGVGPDFHPGTGRSFSPVMRQVGILLFFSRILLALQYSWVLVYARRIHGARMSLILIIGLEVCLGDVCLALALRRGLGMSVLRGTRY